MTQCASNVAWQVAPGPGKCNTMTVESAGTRRAFVKLQVLKPGIRKELEAIVPCMPEQVTCAATGMAANWHVELNRSDQGGIFTAVRLFYILGTPYVLRWTLKHVDIHGDGSLFTVEDTLEVLCVTPDRSGALHLIAI